MTPARCNVRSPAAGLCPVHFQMHLSPSTVHAYATLQNVHAAARSTGQTACVASDLHWFLTSFDAPQLTAAAPHSPAINHVSWLYVLPPIVRAVRCPACPWPAVPPPAAHQRAPLNSAALADTAFTCGRPLLATQHARKAAHMRMPRSRPPASPLLESSLLVSRMRNTNS